MQREHAVTAKILVNWEVGALPARPGTPDAGVEVGPG